MFEFYYRRPDQQTVERLSAIDLADAKRILKALFPGHYEYIQVKQGPRLYGAKLVGSPPPWA